MPGPSACELRCDPCCELQGTVMVHTGVLRTLVQEPDETAFGMQFTGLSGSKTLQIGLLSSADVPLGEVHPTVFQAFNLCAWLQLVSC